MNDKNDKGPSGSGGPKDSNDDKMMKMMMQTMPAMMAQMMQQMPVQSHQERQSMSSSSQDNRREAAEREEAERQKAFLVDRTKLELPEGNPNKPPKSLADLANANTMFVKRKHTFATDVNKQAKLEKKRARKERKQRHNDSNQDRKRRKDKSKKKKKEQEIFIIASSDSSSSSSSSSSALSASQVFRVASGATTKSCQDQLIKFPRRNPGKLAASTLQDWDARSALGAERPVYKYDDTPACARRFLQVVVKPELPAGVNLRNVRELEVLAMITDLLAQGRLGECADALTQRMIAVRMAVDDTNWSKAAFIELTPQDPSAMVPKSLRAMALKEADAHRKLQPSTTSAPALNVPKASPPAGDYDPAYWNNLMPRPRGKGKGGKDKGGKGKDGKPRKKW